MPLLHPDMAAQLLDVLEKQLRGVFAGFGCGFGAPGAALVEGDDAVYGWVEEDAV